MTGVREARITYHGRRTKAFSLTGSPDVASFFRSKFPDDGRERCVALTVNARNEPMNWTVVSIGGIDQCVVDPRVVFRIAILDGAAGIVLAHNHPSGSPLPSREDKVLTSNLREGAKLLDLRFLDHIILADGSGEYFSFLDEGILNE